jgi:hypothetical protein
MALVKLMAPALVGTIRYLALICQLLYTDMHSRRPRRSEDMVKLTVRWPPFLSSPRPFGYTHRACQTAIRRRIVTLLARCGDAA